MKKLNLKMQGIGEMLSKEQMKNVTGGYGCPIKLGQPCVGIVPQYGTSPVSGQCTDSPTGECKCKIGPYYIVPFSAYCNN